ncbi:MAG: alanine--glyoxylate aminotransferase family protein [Dehalococcoidia bacterium]|nr:alanine--glyoxylate aminotransferase family protein [Dehalococcoidia bacterium]
MENLRIPGPTPCPPEVLQVMTKQMINHRGAEFAEMLNGVTANLKTMFQTKNDVLCLTGSGTGGMETAIVNVLSPGDKVLSATCGVFGDRFATIAQVFGAEVVSIKAEMGRAVDVGAIKAALQKDATIKAVLVTHNETSTGVTNDLASIARTAKEFGKLLIVDAISSLGSIDCPVDKWQIDVAITGSQKGWMAPPGLTMLSISETAWKAHAASKMPKVYWDITRAKRYLERGQTPWTPAISVVYALSISLNMMLKEGLQNVFARHARLAEQTRKGVKAMGLKLLPVEEKIASNTVTAIWPPEGVDADKMRKTMRDKYRVVLSGGQGSLEGKIFRIGHLGLCSEKDIEDTLSALRKSLPEHGYQPK